MSNLKKHKIVVLGKEIEFDFIQAKNAYETGSLLDKSILDSIFGSYVLSLTLQQLVDIYVNTESKSDKILIEASLGIDYLNETISNIKNNNIKQKFIKSVLSNTNLSNFSKRDITYLTIKRYAKQCNKDWIKTCDNSGYTFIIKRDVPNNRKVIEIISLQRHHPMNTYFKNREDLEHCLNILGDDVFNL